MEKPHTKRPYKPSPSLLGTCQRRLAYWARGTPYELNPLYELRARRGQAIHLVILDVLDFIFTHSPMFADLESYHVLAQERPLKYGEDWGFSEGTPDIILRLDWKDHLEVAVFDLKCYRNVPNEPYESNVWQMQAYIEGARENGIATTCGYIVYFPDSGEPAAARIERDPSIQAFSRWYFQDIGGVAAVPERLDYHDIRCSYCPFWDECWGELAEAIAAQKPAAKVIGWDELSSETQGVVSGLIKCREENRVTKKTEQSFFDSLVRFMTDRGMYSVKAKDGRAVSLDYVNKKDGSGYYTIKITGQEAA
jgi:hypothetical protein